MGWDWTTYKSWTTSEGIVVRVVAVAGMIGAGSLLWHERTPAHYPAAVDQAECVGAMQERLLAGGMAYVPHVSSWRNYDGTNWTSVVQTNATGFYPSRDVFMNWIPAWMQALRGFPFLYVDLWGADEASSGRNITGGRPWELYGDDYNHAPIADDEEMGDDWWTSNIWADAEGFGDLQYTHTNQFYMTTNILYQVARPLAAMRWTYLNPWEQGTGMVTNTYPGGTNEVNWYTETALYAPGTDWATVLADLVSKHAATVPDADIEALDNLMVLEHYAIIARYTDITNAVMGQLFETVTFMNFPEWEPPVSNLVRSVWEHGVFKIYPGADHFYCAIPTETNRWEQEQRSPIVNDRGRTVYRTDIYRWDGQFDLDDLEAFGADACLAQVMIGWEPARDSGFLVDWRFQCLTNTAAIWGTDFGIR